uniref:Low-density lipoprotein receptor-related protein 6 n=1 Tax=Heterorhabditis bacteriophora TaxID=37862 RepID=A0A1I7WLF5_HETBA
MNEYLSANNVVLLVPSISEDLSVLLAVNIEKGVGYFTARNHLYSTVLSNGSSVDMGKIGFGMEDTPTSIAIDWITNQVYIALSGVGHDSSAKIYVCSLSDVTNCSVIIHSNLEYLYSLALDPLDGFVFFYNFVLDQSSGSSSSKGVTYSSLTLHSKSRRLYFVKTRIKSSEIWSCELYKRDSCEAIIETELVLHFSVSEVNYKIFYFYFFIFCLNIFFQSYLIWSTNHPGHLVFCAINNCKNTKISQGDVIGVESFVVVDPSAQPPRLNPNPCARNNGDCSHFCLLLHFHPWAYCACPVGIRLLEDKKTCHPNGLDKGFDQDKTHKFYDIDFDPISKKIYWIDAGIGYIRRCYLNGSATENVLSVSNTVRAFRLDFGARNIYWIDSKLARIYIKHSPYSWPNGIVIDGLEERLYWTEGNYSLIKTAMLDGSEEHQIGPVSFKLPQPYAITKLGNMLFCNSLAGRSLMKIYVDIKDGKADGVASCLCSAGFEIQKDGYTCKQATEFLILAQAEVPDIIRMSLTKPLNNESIGITHMGNAPSAIDIDQRGNYLIFAGALSGEGYIKRVSMKGAIAETVFSGSRLDGIHSIGVDWISRNIYWLLFFYYVNTSVTNIRSNRVEVCDYNGRFIRTLAWKGIFPRDIVVYSAGNSIFFVNSGVNVTIRRMPFSGQPNGGTDILGDLSTVRSLTIDSKKEQLYWSEFNSYVAKVSVSRLDGKENSRIHGGSNRELLFVGTDQTPHKLFYFNYKLYYSDDKNSVIGYYDEKRFIALHDEIYNVTALLIYHGHPSIHLNDCAIEKSQCPQLCFPNDNIQVTQTEKMLYMCACADHLTFDQSSQTCKGPENSVIIGSENQFLMMNLRRHSDKSFSWREVIYFILSGIFVVFPSSFSFYFYLFYVDVSPFLHSPAIVQCQLDGRKCEVWLSKDLWPGTRIHADATYLKLFYTCPSGVWSRDVAMATSNIRHYYISPNASEYAVAPVGDGRVLIAEISSRYVCFNNIYYLLINNLKYTFRRSKVIDIATNSTIDLPNNIVSLQRFTHLYVYRTFHASFLNLPATMDSHVFMLRKNVIKYRTALMVVMSQLRYVETLAQIDGPVMMGLVLLKELLYCLSQYCYAMVMSIVMMDPMKGIAGLPHFLKFRNIFILFKFLLIKIRISFRCASPSQEMDCGALPLLVGGECVRRSLICDGFPDCENAADENPKMCAEYPHPTMRYQSSPEWLYFVLLGIIVFLSISFVIFCCFRNHPLCTSRTDISPGYRMSSGAEASILLPSNPVCATQVELRTYSVVTSTSSYPALPPPNSARSESISSSRNHSSKKDIPLNRFYAPPPSAARYSVRIIFITSIIGIYLLYVLTNFWYFI